VNGSDDSESELADEIVANESNDVENAVLRKQLIIAAK
jgi:hypothetical protein